MAPRNPFSHVFIGYPQTTTTTSWSALSISTLRSLWTFTFVSLSYHVPMNAGRPTLPTSRSQEIPLPGTSRDTAAALRGASIAFSSPRASSRPASASPEVARGALTAANLVGVGSQPASPRRSPHCACSRKTLIFRKDPRILQTDTFWACQIPRDKADRPHRPTLLPFLLLRSGLPPKNLAIRPQG